MKFGIIGKTVDAFKDYGRQVAIAVDPNRSKPRADFTRHTDGSLEHNVDLSDFPAKKRATAEELVHRSIEEIETAEAKLADARANGDAALQEKCENDLEAAKESFTEVKWQLETRDIDVVTVYSAIMFGPGVFVTEGLRTGKQDKRLEDASEQYHMITGGESSGSTSAASSSSSSDRAAGADSEEMSEAFQRIGDDVEGAVARFDSDPKAFFEELEAMTPEERSMAMTMIQNQIQENNRLMSMLTNFQKAMHDTNKAVIANLRV